MAFKSVLNKPVVLESFEHEIMLHAQGLAESGIYRRTRHDTVIIYKGKPKCMYDVTDHGGAIALNRVYTIDDEPLISSALKMAESRWPTNLVSHSCDDCLRMAPGLAIRADRPEGDPASLICHLATACGDIRPAIKGMNEKADFLRALGVDAFHVWVDTELYEVPKSVWALSLALKERITITADN